MINILLAGVGGQGTVLASKIIAKAAILRGEPAHTAETIGMAQRGGCVVSHVRVGSGVYSPLIPKGTADIIIGFEPSEAVRSLPYLKEGGTVVVSSGEVKPVTDSLSDDVYNGSDMIKYLQASGVSLIVVDPQRIISECGAKSLNIALLGAAAASGISCIPIDELRKIIKTELSEKFMEANLKALELGFESAK